MHLRQPLPRLWLMTDERQGEGLWDALDRLPRGAGIVVRHYSLTPDARRALVARIVRQARRRGQSVFVAGDNMSGGDGHHGPMRGRGRGLRSASVHSIRELRRAERAGVALAFVSPVHATRSHPGARPLGAARFGLLLHNARIPVIALGGMNPRRGDALMRMGAYGWAAIDAWSAPKQRGSQKRKAVPI